MSHALVFLCLLSQAEAVDKPTVELYQDVFIVRKGETAERIPTVVAPKPPPLSVLYRRDKTYLVWDERGMTIRVGDKVQSTRLPELAVTPKLFPRDEIRKNLARFDSGERTKEATSLSGSRRIGTTVYMLPRWNDRKGEPWLEALVSVDLTEANPKPKLIGRYDGFTLSKRLIDEQLFVQDGKIHAMLQRDNNWGLGSYTVEESAFDFMTLGDKLRQFLPLQWPNARFVEETAYGTTVAGQTNLLDANRKNLAEGRGPMKLLDALEPPLLSMTTTSGPILRNLDSGSELKLTGPSGFRRTSMGVLVWTPEKEPKAATLYDPIAWKVVAKWSLTSPKPATK